jgi:hypothetical protein
MSLSLTDRLTLRFAAPSSEAGSAPVQQGEAVLVAHVLDIDLTDLLREQANMPRHLADGVRGSPVGFALDDVAVQRFFDFHPLTPFVRTVALQTSSAPIAESASDDRENRVRSSEAHDAKSRARYASDGN